MARGWESKSVESQQEAAEERRLAAEQVVKTTADVARERERDGLQLSRTRILRELEAARTDRHRVQLRAALAHLDAKLAELG